MRVANNLMTLNTLNKQKLNKKSKTTSMERLSSGLRINRASDDAAGLAISQKMRAQIRGLNQASRNAQDGISLVQTAEGAIGEMVDITQRIRELCVQGANNVLATDDRENIQLELDELKNELNHISRDTTFNSKHLLDGSLSENANGKVAIVNQVVETIIETVVETTYETVKEMQEQTIYTPISTTHDVVIDIDLSNIGDSETITVMDGTDEVKVTLNRTGDTILQVEYIGNGNLLKSESVVTNTNATSFLDKTYGNFAQDNFKSIISTSDGGYAVLGTSSYSGGDVPNHIGQADFWVMKFDEDFNVEWSKALGTTLGEGGFNLVELSNGDFLATGNRNDWNGSTWTSNAYALRLDKDSNKIWDKTYYAANELQSNIYATSLASNDDILLVGYKGDGGSAESSGNISSTFLYRVDANTGNLIDQDTISPVSDTILQSSCATFSPNGNAISGGHTVFHVPYHSQILFEYNEHGFTQWYKTYELGAFDEIATMSDGSIVAAGYELDSSYNLSNYMLYKFDSDGNKLWEEIIPSECQGLSISDNDEIYLTTDDKTSWITTSLLYDDSGNKIWEESVFNDNRPLGAYIDDEGNLFSVGTSRDLNDAYISGFKPPNIFPDEYLTGEITTEFGAQQKKIISSTIEFDSSSSSLKAINLSMNIAYNETTTQWVEVDVVKEIQTEKEVEKTIVKDVITYEDGIVDNSINLQIGANSGETMHIAIEDMSPETIGFINEFPSVNPIEMAGVSIEVSDSALTILNQQRSSLGAQHNALEHIIKNVDNASENLQAAESRITDTDMAKEMMELTKQNILSEAINAIMVQANSVGKDVLKLLE